MRRPARHGLRVGRLPAGALLAAGLLVVGCPAPGRAQAGPDPSRREDEIRALEQRARTSQESRGRLDREVSALRADGPRLAATLVAAAAAARDAEDRVRTAEERLARLTGEESGIARGLAGRRTALTEVLAALQRLGLHPPPPLAVRAADVVDAIRSAILLGSVAPALRQEADRLAAELGRLGQLRSAIAADRAVLESELGGLAAERDRVAALVRVRQERLAAAESDLGRERFRSERLGQETRSLRELIDRMEEETARERQRAEAHAARPDPPRPAPAPPDPKDDPAERQARERFAAAAAREPVRLAPRQPLGEARGLLTRPVAGPVLREFGAPDGAGGTMRGSAMAARPGALVTAPADGTVVFAGPFRSYGRLLIINAGGGYYFLLAGMDATAVEAGQFVLAGEPVAQMGTVAAPSAALGVVETGDPVLYVELRKDGGPIDPSPWWARSKSERARG